MPVLNNPVTKALALVKDEFHHGTCTRTHGPRGGERETVVRYRRMGATKTWKTRPEEFRVPVKFGMRARDSWEITHENGDEFHAADDCPLSVAEYRDQLQDGRIVEVTKAGGGTLGRRYDGDWVVAIWDRKGRTLLMDDKLRTGTPKTHAEVAAMTVEFADEGESDG